MVVLGLSPGVSAKLGLTAHLGSAPLHERLLLAGCLAALVLLPVGWDRLMLKKFAPDVARAIKQVRPARLLMHSPPDDDLTRERSRLGRFRRRRRTWQRIRTCRAR